MPTYMAKTEWTGDFEDGTGRTHPGSAAFDISVSPRARYKQRTNPEELIGASLSSCYSFMLARVLAEAGHHPELIRTIAAVDRTPVDGRVTIPRIGLQVVVKADGLDEDELTRLAKQADEACGVLQALGGTEIRIRAQLAK